METKIEVKRDSTSDFSLDTKYTVNTTAIGRNTQDHSI